MSANDESDASVAVSELETQFVPRSDDEEVLWEVQEITAERGKKYKVKWVGTDPVTGKPWAQSWVAKHDCTDDLVYEWKKKKLGVSKTRDGRASTASRASGSSKHTRSSTFGKRTRAPTSDATTSRLDLVREHRPSSSEGATVKRKRQSETPVTTTTATTMSGRRQDDKQNELSRPRKKQRLMLEVLVPPLSSSEDEDDAPILDARARVAARESRAPSKGKGAVAMSDSSGEDGSPPKAKGKSVRLSDRRSKGAAASSRASGLREESRRRDSRAKTRGDRRRREERVADVGVLSDASSREDEPQPIKPRKKSTSNLRVSSPKRNDDLPEKETVLASTPVKVGPPRGVKRKEVSRPPTGSTSSRARLHEDESAHERVSIEGSEDRPDDDASSFGEPLLLLQRTAVSPPPTLPSPRISIPEVILTERPRSPDLSPGARARLNIFDQMMAGALEPDPAPPVDVRERTPDDTHINYNDEHDDCHAFDASDPPRVPTPPPSKPEPRHLKLGAPNGLVVPETESSGPSQSQSHALPAPRLSSQPPPPARGSPHRPTDLPTIAVITASVTSSSASPQDLFPPSQRLPPLTKRPSERPAVKLVPQIPPSTFRSTVNVRSLIADSEAPPSSIESFASPMRVAKGKQKAVEDNQLQSSLSEGEGNGKRRERPTQRKLTDSELRQRGMELFDQMQLARETERQAKRKVKRLKTIDEIACRAVSPPSKRSPLPLASGAESTLEMPLEDVIDLTGGANSTTLDTAEHSEARQQLSEEEKARLRIELRQEEEESTQEAMGVFPPAEEPRAVNGGNGQMLTPGSPQLYPITGRPEDADHVEHPSADIQLASVVVQPSQEQPFEDADTDPLPASQPTSSPLRVIPESLTESPKRRLGEALSLLNVKSEEIQRLQRELTDERENVQRLKTEITEVKQSSEPTGPVLAAWEAERAQWTQERTKWKEDFATWETQREEWCSDRANLTARVAELLDAAARAKEGKVKLSELETERAAWIKERDSLRSDVARRTEELEALTNARNEDDKDRSKWDAERAVWVEEKSRWESERAELQERQGAASRSVEELSASVQSLTSAKASAGKDRDLFRELYMQASAFVGSIRDENAELEKRVEIAEGQAQEGVAAIKSFHEARIKALQADVDHWKGLAVFLQEKDRRTNDEVRLRAARVPELGDLCGRLAAEKKSLEAEIQKLGRAQDRSVAQRNKLYCKIFELQKNRVSLRSKLSKLAKMVGDSTQETVPPASASAPAPPILEDVDPNDMDTLPGPTPSSSSISLDEPLLFPCLWRPQWRDQCQSAFDTREDLERHTQDHLQDLIGGEQ